MKATPPLFTAPRRLSRRVRRAAVAAAALLPLAVPAAQARPADCRFVFEGTTYIDGPCDFQPGEGAGFRVSADGYIVELGVFDGKGEGSWNGDTRAGHLHHPLHMDGPLTRTGACWQSPSVQLCAWGGRRPGAAPKPPERQEAVEVLVPGKTGIDAFGLGSWSFVQVRKQGRVDHCYGSVLPEPSTAGGPLKLSVDRAGQWVLSGPPGGTARGWKGRFEVEYHKASGELAGENPSGQRVLMPLGPGDLRALESGANLLLGYGKVPVYELSKTREALALLRRCVSG